MTQYTNVDSARKAAELTKPLEVEKEKKRTHLLNNAATYISILVFALSVVLYSYNKGFSSVYSIPVNAMPIDIKSYIPIAVQVIGVMMWILYYVSMVQQEKALNKRKFNLLRVMYGFSIIHILMSYNQLDRLLGTIWSLVIPLLISLLFESGLYFFRRPVKRKAIDESTYKMRIEDYVFDRILSSYLVRYGLCFLVIAVIFAEPIGRLSAKAKCDYQICFYDDKAFAVILEYDDRVLVQQATTVNENTLYIDISNYRYIEKDGLKLINQKYEKVSLLTGNGDV